MRTFLLFYFFFCLGMKAQNVNIPDAVFKAKLISLGFDINNDGEISQDEADAIVNLNVSNTPITSIEGLQYFHNISILNLSYANLTTISIDGLSLDQIDLSHNSSLYSITLSNIPALTILNFDYTAITSLNFINVSGLQYIRGRYINSNGFSVDLSNLELVNSNVNFSNSTISSLNVSGSNVAMVTASDSTLQTLLASNTPNLSHVICSSCQITEFEINNSNVWQISGGGGNLTSFDVSGLSNLYFFAWVDAGLQSVDFSGCEHLFGVEVSGNQLTTLDLSECPNLGGFVNANPNPLETVLVKNGINEGQLNVFVPTLQYLCVDESQLASVMSSPQAANVTVSPYCFLTPGGNFNDLSGSVTYDIDNDGCDAQDPGQAFTALSFTSGTNQYTAFTLTDGDYLSYITGTGNYLIQPALENPSLFTVTPPPSQVLLSGTTTSADLNFCIAPNGIHQDVEVTIAPLGAIRPGFDASYAVTYRNKGNQLENGQVSFQFDDDKLDLVSTSQVPANSATGSLSWNFTGLLPYESRTIVVTVNANSPVETPPVNIGDIMTYNSNVSLLQTDENPTDNAFTFHQTVVGSYDPNDIACLEGDVVDPSLIGKFLHYNVNFENTGNYPAENVVVRMKMDASKFDMNTLQFIDSSHQPRVQRNDDLVEFIFEGIQLQPEGKGNVLFKIKTKNTLVTGNSVSQKADIYFDFNAPVATNTATTTFQQLGMQTPAEEPFVLWPNPASNLVTISGATDIETISLFNLLGQEVARQKGNGRGAQVDVSSLPTGNFLVRVKAAGGEQLMKLVKK